MTILSQQTADVKQINFSDDTYAVIDPTAGAVSIHRGQQLGKDSDWGGQCSAWLELDKALAILEAVRALAMPADFAEALAEVEANGIRYTPKLDHDAIEDEVWGS